MIPLVDAHHHIWRQADLAWLQGPPQPRIFGEYAAIRRDYPIEEYMAEARAAGVVRSVYVQTNWPAGREEEEVAWVQAVADRHGFPHAIVGYADLAAPAVGAALDRMTKHSRLRGIRQQLHWHEKDLYRFAARPDLMDDPVWRSGLVEVARRGLLFELQVFAGRWRRARGSSGTSRRPPSCSCTRACWRIPRPTPGLAGGRACARWRRRRTCA
jgi:predicted TIM-barrel fold metal-dependent hydrolase